MGKQYINLHAHSTGSLLDGASKFDEYAERAKELGQPLITFTDHGNVTSILDAYDAAQAAGIKYAPGIEAYQARKTRFDKDEEERAGKARYEWDQRGPHHLGLIAYNNVGYHNLIKLSSRSYTEGYFVKPRIDKELIAEHAEGLIILSGCLSGMVQEAILRGDYEYALQTAAEMQDMVGRGNYFIEMHNHDIPEEAQTWESLKKIAKTIGAPIVVSGDTHYTRREDHNHHDIMLCLNTKSFVSDENRFRFSNDEFYLKSYDEMVALFGEEEYVDNTMLVYDKFDFQLDFKENHYPKYPIPVAELTTEQYLRQEIIKGAVARFGENWRDNQVIRDRLNYEFNTIKELDFMDYFLVVADIVNFAKDNDILCGPARGSVAGCLIAYCLMITEVDPIKYGLIFERFLVPGRKSPPDIDLDFDTRYREMVIEYTRNKYGWDHTAQIGTMGRIKAKTAIRDVSRVLEHPYELGDELSKAMPPSLFGVPRTLSECLESEAFLNIYNSNPDAKTVIDTALKIEGLWRNPGIHAAGLIVADKPITEYIPVSQKGEDAPIVSQWEMGRIDQLGLLKVDFLGLRNLDMISECIKTIKETRGVVIDNPYDLLDDSQAADLVFKTLSNGKTTTSFQLESKGITELAMGIQPDCIEDISAILALYRPGPMGSNVHNEYIDRKFGRKRITYPHVSLKPILEETYGLMLYQEQLLKIATDVAGFTIMEADDLRKVVGKKIVEKMPLFRDKFVNGCVNTVGMDENSANKLFNEIEHHASYSFGKGHATGYMFLSFVTTYLHAMYPAEYMAAALSTVTDNEDRLGEYLEECRKLGIPVHLPAIDKAEYEFTVKDNHIYYGLEGIKGLSGSIKPIVDEREDGQFNNIFNLLRNVHESALNKKVIEHFMNAGSLDNLLDDLKIFDGMPEMSQSETVKLLLREFKEINAFISGHPYEILKDTVVTNTDFRPIKEAYELEAKDRFTTAGIVTSIDKKMTKRGKPMFNLTIQDLDSAVGVVVMPWVAEGLDDKPFEKGDFLIVKGDIEKYSPNDDPENASVSIRLFDFEIFKAVSEESIYIDTNKTITRNVMEKFIDIIDNNKGDCTVYLSYFDAPNNAKIQVEFNTKVKKETETILNKILMLELSK